MFEKIKKLLNESENQEENSKQEKGIYDFEEKEDKKLKRINILDRIKFIRFSKNNDKDANLHKIKEVGLLVTAVILIGVGYTNFSKNSSNTISTSSTNNIGDVQLVSSSSAIVENDTNNTVQTSSLVSNGEFAEPQEENTAVVSTSTSINNVNASNNSVLGSSNNSFSELKMERNQMLSKNLETYQKIVDSDTISSEQKAIAIQEIEKINNLRNSISVSEELIKLKGFEDVVIYSSNDKISVIVRIADLSDSQVAQIQNIVSKEFNTDISNITISNK